VLAVLGTVITRLSDPDAPDSTERDVVEELARDRARRGFPIDALLRAFQVGARALLEVIDEAASTDPRTTANTLLQIHDYCWEWANHAMSVVAAVHREIAVDLARRDSSQRAEFVRAILHGRIPEPQLHAEATLYGLDAQLRYFTLRARPRDERESTRLELELARSGSTSSRRAIVAVLDGDVVGLAPQRPVVDDALVALGPPATLERAADSFAEAGEALETASAFGIRAVVDLPGLGALPLALAQERAAALLDAAHLARLLEQDRAHEIERTVMELLDRDQDVRATAAALHVHPNTVRYRLARFHELTGLDIRRTDGVIVTWWLLKRRAARAGEPGG
jgi:sugar diacid utilization regulator